MVLLIGLWQKLSADQIAILEAAFLPLQQDTQELVRTHTPAVVTASTIRKVVVLERDHIPIVFFKVSNESLVLFLSKSCFPFLQTIIKMSSKGLFFFFPRAV